MSQTPCRNHLKFVDECVQCTLCDIKATLKTLTDGTVTDTIDRLNQISLVDRLNRIEDRMNYFESSLDEIQTDSSEDENGDGSDTDPEFGPVGTVTSSTFGPIGVATSPMIISPSQYSLRQALDENIVGTVTQPVFYGSGYVWTSISMIGAPGRIKSDQAKAMDYFTSEDINHQIESARRALSFANAADFERALSKLDEDGTPIGPSEDNEC